MPRTLLKPLCLLSLAAAVLVAVGCSPDPFADGRYWRQPSEKKAGRRPLAAKVGIFGQSMSAGIGPGTSVSDAYAENGGPVIGRSGHSADSGTWSGVSTVVGTAGTAADSRVWSETNPHAGVSGAGAQSGAYGETGMRTGTNP